ncbi:hypothetical protein PN36_12160 [Candidatus Thiomargarita nelsonii]|uniref:Uncharacterized protein n=1 Tax=Candidatus Thiomargarita nelsonii TaxID=1003181 RepID=A0A4E0RSX1_9GAMM|nr:hypothetical protein PN36_12160 [Candidatus Thiomargarita nelsonii]
MGLIKKIMKFLLISIILLVLFIIWIVQQPPTLVDSKEGTYNKALSNGGVLKRTWSEQHYVNTSWGDQSVYRSSETKYIPPNGGAPERIRGINNAQLKGIIENAFIINNLVVIPNSTPELVIRYAKNRWRKVSALNILYQKLQERDYFYKEHDNNLSEMKIIIDDTLELSFNYSTLLFNYSFRFRLAKNGRALELVNVTSIPKEKEFVLRKRQAENNLHLKIPSTWVVTKFSGSGESCFETFPASVNLINLEVPNHEQHIIRLIGHKTNLPRKFLFPRKHCIRTGELDTQIWFNINENPFRLQKTKSLSKDRFSHNRFDSAETVHGAIKISKRNFYLYVYAKRINNQIIEEFLSQLDSLNSPKRKNF